MTKQNLCLCFIITVTCSKCTILTPLLRNTFPTDQYFYVHHFTACFWSHMHKTTQLFPMAVNYTFYGTNDLAHQNTQLTLSIRSCPKININMSQRNRRCHSVMWIPKSNINFGPILLLQASNLFNKTNISTVTLNKWFEFSSWF